MIIISLIHDLSQVVFSWTNLFEQPIPLNLR